MTIGIDTDKIAENSLVDNCQVWFGVIGSVYRNVNIWNDSAAAINSASELQGLEYQGIVDLDAVLVEAFS